MAQNIKFTFKINVDGKDSLVEASSNAKELSEALRAARTPSENLRRTLISYNQAVDAVRNVSSAITQIASTLNDATSDYRSFSSAMAEANTMAGKGGEDFSRMKGEVADLAKEVPVARDELARGLYQVISNGVPEDNWISFLKDSAKASVGGIADLGETVKVTSTLIKNYGLDWSQAGDIQDKIQLTAKNGVTSFEQMAQDGTVERYTRHGNNVYKTADGQYFTMKGNYTGRMPRNDFLKRASDQAPAIIENGIKPELEDAVYNRAKKLGWTD